MNSTLSMRREVACHKQIDTTTTTNNNNNSNENNNDNHDNDNNDNDNIRMLIGGSLLGPKQHHRKQPSIYF